MRTYSIRIDINHTLISGLHFRQSLTTLFAKVSNFVDKRLTPKIRECNDSPYLQKWRRNRYRDTNKLYRNIECFCGVYELSWFLNQDNPRNKATNGIIDMSAYQTLLDALEISFGARCKK